MPLKRPKTYNNPYPHWLTPPSLFPYVISGLKFYSIWVSPKIKFYSILASLTTKFYSVSESPTTKFYSISVSLITALVAQA